MRPWCWPRGCLDWCGLADLDSFVDLSSKGSVGLILLPFTVEASLVVFGEIRLESTSSNGVPKDDRGGGDSKFVLVGAAAYGEAALEALPEDDCDDFRRASAGLRFVAAVLTVNAAFFRPGRCEMLGWGTGSISLCIVGEPCVTGCCPSISRCSLADPGRAVPRPGNKALPSMLRLEMLSLNCADDTGESPSLSSSLSFRVVGDKILAVFGKWVAEPAFGLLRIGGGRRVSLLRSCDNESFLGALDDVSSWLGKRADLGMPSLSDAAEDVGEGAKAFENWGGERLVWRCSCSK